MLHPCSLERRFQIIAMYLQGFALTWFQLWRHQLDSWDKFREVFKFQFGQLKSSQYEESGVPKLENTVGLENTTVVVSQRKAEHIKPTRIELASRDEPHVTSIAELQCVTLVVQPHFQIEASSKEQVLAEVVSTAELGNDEIETESKGSSTNNESSLITTQVVSTLFVRRSDAIIPNLVLEENDLVPSKPQVFDKMPDKGFMPKTVDSLPLTIESMELKSGQCDANSQVQHGLFNPTFDLGILVARFIFSLPMRLILGLIQKLFDPGISLISYDSVSNWLDYTMLTLDMRDFACSRSHTLELFSSATLTDINNINLLSSVSISGMYFGSYHKNGTQIRIINNIYYGGQHTSWSLKHATVSIQAHQDCTLSPLFAVMFSPATIDQPGHRDHQCYCFPLPIETNLIRNNMLHVNLTNCQSRMYFREGLMVTYDSGMAPLDARLHENGPSLTGVIAVALMEVKWDDQLKKVVNRKTFTGAERKPEFTHSGNTLLLLVSHYETELSLTNERGSNDTAGKESLEPHVVWKSTLEDFRSTHKIFSHEAKTPTGSSIPTGARSNPLNKPVGSVNEEIAWVACDSYSNHLSTTFTFVLITTNQEATAHVDIRVQVPSLSPTCFIKFLGPSILLQAMMIVHPFLMGLVRHFCFISSKPNQFIVITILNNYAAIDFTLLTWLLLIAWFDHGMLLEWVNTCMKSLGQCHPTGNSFLWHNIVDDKFIRAPLAIGRGIGTCFSEMELDNTYLVCSMPEFTSQTLYSFHGLWHSTTLLEWILIIAWIVYFSSLRTMMFSRGW